MVLFVDQMFVGRELIAMPKGDKYAPLTKFLEACGKDRLTLSFDKIETIIGLDLPPSAYKHRAFWSNTMTHPVSVGWLDASYRTVRADLKNKLITLEKA